MTGQPVAQLPALARLVRLIESWPDVPADVKCERDALRDRAALRDRMGQIITIDRAGTQRSISHSRAL